MTSKQQETYERMLAQAKRDLLAVRGHGTVKATGDAVYAVQSKSEPNRLHLVRVRDLTLTCDCVAAQFGRYCSHRALVRARLELEAAVKQDCRERQVEQAFHAAARELNVKLDALGPKPRTDTREFSVFK